MSHLDFSFTTDTKESLKKDPYEVGIHSGNIITEVSYNEQYDAIDIVFENPENNWTIRERMFNPLKGDVPEWTTPERELALFKARIKHILKRFVPEEQCLFSANSFREMAVKVAAILKEYAIDTKAEVSIKVHWDKNFKFPELAKNKFLANDRDPELKFSTWELNNRMISDEVSDEVGSAEEEIF